MTRLRQLFIALAATCYVFAIFGVVASVVEPTVNHITNTLFDAVIGSISLWQADHE